MSVENPVIAIPHYHTEYSNKSFTDIKGVETSNHYTASIAQLAETIPSDIDLFFTRTDHYKTDPDYWEKTKKEVERRGGEAYKDDLVLRGELEGTRFWGINGVETALEDDLKKEYIAYGLELDDSQNHICEDYDEMLELTESTELGVIPHPFMMDFDWEEGREEFIEKALDYDVELGIGYSTGYGTLNNVSNGYWFNEEDVKDLTERYDLPAIPDIDYHAYLPGKISLVDRSAIDKLEADEIPVEEMKDMRIVQEEGLKSGLRRVQDTIGAGLTFVDMMPVVGSQLSRHERFYKFLRDSSLRNFANLESDKLLENSVRLNGEKSPL